MKTWVYLPPGVLDFVAALFAIGLDYRSIHRYYAFTASNIESSGHFIKSYPGPVKPVESAAIPWLTTQSARTI